MRFAYHYPHSDKTLHQTLYSSSVKLWQSAAPGCSLSLNFRLHIFHMPLTIKFFSVIRWGSCFITTLTKESWSDSQGEAILPRECNPTCLCQGFVLGLPPSKPATNLTFLAYLIGRLGLDLSEKIFRFPLPQFIFNWSIATRIVINYLVQPKTPCIRPNGDPTESRTPVLRMKISCPDH